MLKFTPEDFHTVYLETAKKMSWPVRPECDVPFEELNDDAKALDIALCEFAQTTFDEWLASQPKAYSAVPNNSLWMKCSDGSVPSTYKHACYLIPVEEK